MASLYSDEQESPEPGKRGWWRRFFGRFSGGNVLHGPAYRTRHIASRATFTVLLGLSAVFGVMCGLMLVYSIDLPQMNDLARYRPSTTTELLDIHGREIGSFALERRVVVPYTAFPPVLRDALLSIEDKTFERNW